MVSTVRELLEKGRPEDIAIGAPDRPPLTYAGQLKQVESTAAALNALKVFGWLEEVNPTWYTAVPTMHQTILSRAHEAGCYPA